MIDENVLSYFKNGGVYLFNESILASEASFYKVEAILLSDFGQMISDFPIDEIRGLYVFYDSSKLNQHDALKKYLKGDYVVSF